ncbi:2'-5' RNA ligase family protein [Rossellomorea aquimaris]|uniref:2'-5' RNA ligase family protein n=1 Tax=Rossellomorea aquimaris TaxID=189382 RepID=UPI0007D05D20|nr:2'-5' RNA ligase family protein [Rossellomorea aquimaris]
MFGVIAIFDEKTEQNIKNLWEGLHDEKITSYAYEVENRQPHLTLASYEDLNKERFMELMDTYYENKPAIPLSFQLLGTFINSGTLFLSPVVTEELMNLHLQHHQFFNLDGKEDSLYSPGKWIPHCTIANRLTQLKLLEAFNYCSSHSKILSGIIKEIALIELQYDHGKCVGAPVVFSKKLLMEVL